MAEACTEALPGLLLFVSQQARATAAATIYYRQHFSSSTYKLYGNSREPRMAGKKRRRKVFPLFLRSKNKSFFFFF